jgi:hypothetical protein
MISNVIVVAADQGELEWLRVALRSYNEAELRAMEAGGFETQKGY